MEQSPSWETDRFLASQEISRVLWNPDVHYSVLKSTPLVPVSNHINPVHIPIPLPEDTF
jgi:hypothetical protein